MMVNKTMKEKYQLFNGNNIDKLRELEDNSVDAVVTDPPYGLSFMGKKWDYDVPSVELWAECFRVLKPGGHLLAFAGTRTQHRMAVRIEDAGFEIRDMIAWVYGSGFPKSLNVGKIMDKYIKTGNASWNGTGDSSNGALGYSKLQKKQGYRPNDYSHAHQTNNEITEQAAKQWEGWGTALKPAMEPITVARKPLIGTVAENVLQYGTGGLNIDNSRVDFVSDADRKESTDKNQHADFGTAPITNNIVYGDYSMMKPKNYNPPGRWPANLIHDGSDEVVELFPMSNGSGNSRLLNRSVKPNQEGWGMNKNAPDEVWLPHAGSGSAARFFYCPKVSKSERNAGRDNKHPTVKPIDLMRYLCKLITPPCGIVLDPFMGSGSTGCAALLDGFKFIGMELEEEYFKIAEARINHFNPADFW